MNKVVFALLLILAGALAWLWRANTGTTADGANAQEQVQETKSRPENIRGLQTADSKNRSEESRQAISETAEEHLTIYLLAPGGDNAVAGRLFRQKQAEQWEEIASTEDGEIVLRAFDTAVTLIGNANCLRSEPLHLQPGESGEYRLQLQWSPDSCSDYSAVSGKVVVVQGDYEQITCVLAMRPRTEEASPLIDWPQMESWHRFGLDDIGKDGSFFIPMRYPETPPEFDFRVEVYWRDAFPRDLVKTEHLVIPLASSMIFSLTQGQWLDLGEIYVDVIPTLTAQIPPRPSKLPATTEITWTLFSPSFANLQERPLLHGTWPEPNPLQLPLPYFLAGEEAYLLVKFQGVHGRSSAVRIRQGMNDFGLIPLPYPAHLHGTVLNQETGQPMNAFVVLTPAEQKAETQPEFMNYQGRQIWGADDDGKFDGGWINPGEYQIMAVRRPEEEKGSAWYLGRDRIFLQPGEERDYTFSVGRPSQVLSGTIEGVPQEHMRRFDFVIAWDRDGQLSSIGDVRNGEFKLALNELEDLTIAAQMGSRDMQKPYYVASQEVSAFQSNSDLVLKPHKTTLRLQLPDGLEESRVIVFRQDSGNGFPTRNWCNRWKWLLKDYPLSVYVGDTGRDLIGLAPGTYRMLVVSNDNGTGHEWVQSTQ